MFLLLTPIHFSFVDILSRFWSQNFRSWCWKIHISSKKKV